MLKKNFQKIATSVLFVSMVFITGQNCHGMKGKDTPPIPGMPNCTTWEKGDKVFFNLCSNRITCNLKECSIICEYVPFSCQNGQWGTAGQSTISRPCCITFCDKISMSKVSKTIESNPNYSTTSFLLGGLAGALASPLFICTIVVGGAFVWKLAKWKCYKKRTQVPYVELANEEEEDDTRNQRQIERTKKYVKKALKEKLKKYLGDNRDTRKKILKLPFHKIIGILFYITSGEDEGYIDEKNDPEKLKTILKDLSENGQNLLEKLLEKLLGDDSDAIGKIQNIHYIEFLTLIDYLRSKDFQKDGANLLLKKIAETGRLFFDAGDDDEDDEN